ncbi:MAG: nucleotide-binding protein [Pseudomonadota bacterium]
MNSSVSKIDKLIETGEEFQWENYSVVSNGRRFGHIAPAWTTWVSRIENILKQTSKPSSEPYVYFNAANKVAIEGNFSDKFDFAKENYIKALLKLKTLMNEGDIFDDLLKPTDPIDTIKPQKKINSAVLSQSNKKVFIVHGHDHALKIELEVFLSHIGLKPVVLHREVDGGQTIIEKFEANSDVSFAFILLTPDEISYTLDQASIKDEQRKKETRARPNVIFEFGYFVAKLGRHKVCALHKGDVAIPTDLSGFIYKKVDNNVEEIGFSLIKELKAAGLKPEV